MFFALHHKPSLQQCLMPNRTPTPPKAFKSRGGCGGRLHGIWGEVEDPDNDNLLHRICATCLAAKSAGHDASNARAGKRKALDTRGREAGPWKGSKPPDRSESRYRLSHQP